VSSSIVVERASIRENKKCWPLEGGEGSYMWGFHLLHSQIKHLCCEFRLHVDSLKAARFLQEGASKRDDSPRKAREE